MPSDHDRIIGYDMARAMAILAMVPVNLASVMDTAEYSPAWMETVVGYTYGRAATIFVMLAGLSVTLLTRRQGKTASTIYHGLMKRSLLLLVGGWVLWHWWEADILHFYSLFLMIGALIARRPDLWVKRFTLIVFVLSMPVCAFLTLSYDLNDAIPYVETQPPGIQLVLDYITSPFYPVFPWLGFFSLGMLLGRREPVTPMFCRRLFVISSLVCIGIELFADTASNWAWQNNVDLECNWWGPFLRSEAFPDTPLFVASSGASALAVISLCRWVTLDHEKKSPIVGFLAIFGQFSLTMYVAHLVWGFILMGWVIETGRIADQPVVATGLFYLIGFCFTAGWQRHFTRGPLEMLFHLLTHKQLFHRKHRQPQPASSLSLSMPEKTQVLH